MVLITRIYALLFKNGIGRRLQLPENNEFRSRLISQLQLATVHFACLLRKPLYVPSTEPFNIPHNKLESIKVECGNSIETNVEEDQGPFEESVLGVSWNKSARYVARYSESILTASNFVHLVLDEKIDQGHQSTKEQTSYDLAVLRSAAVVTTKSHTTQCPWQSRYQVRNHEDVVPVMVIRRGDIGPPTTSKRPKHPNTRNDLRQRRVRPGSQDIPKEDKRESRTGRNGNEDLEEGTFGVSITNGCGYGREPFVGVAVVFILDDFMEMQVHAHDQGAEEGGVCEECMGPSHPFSI